MARPLALVAAAVAVALLAVSGAGGAAAQTPRRGGTVVFAQPQPEPACLNPLVERCAPGTAAIPLDRILNRVLDAPFDVGPNLTWRPGLVASATFTRRAPFTLTYRIRPEARWSDGVPVTAQDFVFTHRAILRSGNEQAKELHQNVLSVRAVDAKTVRIVLRARIASWRGLFWGHVLPSHVLREVSVADVWRDRIDDPHTGRPIGSGPFLVESWQRGKQLTLVRNPRWWGPHLAYLDRLVVRFGVDGQGISDALHAGTMQVAYGFPPALAPDVRRDSGVTFRTTPVGAWEHLDFRLGYGGNPLLKDKRVREAIAYGIDRVALAQQLSRETGLAFRVLDSAVSLTQSPGYAANWSRYRYLPAEARRRLEQIGCRRGDDGIYTCDRVRLQLRFFTHVSPGSYRPHVLEIIQKQLREAGVDVRPTFAPQAAIFAQGGVLEQGDFDGVLFAWIQTSPNTGYKDLYGCGAPQNYTGYCQRLVTSDLDQADRILGEKQLVRVLNRADVRLARDVPVLPLFQPGNWAATTRDLRGFGLFPNNDGMLGAENWWLDR